MKRKNGFIDVDDMLRDIGIIDTSIDKLNNYDKSIEVSMLEDNDINFNFIHNGITYYFKYDNDIDPYDELIAEELAQDFGIPHVKYDLAIYDSKEGVISESFKQDNINYITGEEILAKFYVEDNNTDAYNNLEAIWDAFEYRYRDYPNKKDIIEKLMRRLVHIFLFDIITCQSDRHPNNWQVMESEDDVDITQIFDNERILGARGLTNICSLTVEEKMFGNLYDNLRLFFGVSSEEFCNIIKDKIWIISKENLNLIFKRIEEKTGYPMPHGYRKYYLDGYNLHLQKLEQLLNDIKLKERDESNERKNR